MVSILTVCNVRLLGQNDYLSTLNYNNLQVNRIGSAIPGVTWIISDNSAYDANHQRFFFQGNATSTPPWYLYTIDATSGSVISSPTCPSNNLNASVVGLQYDNKNDTLYALYLDKTGAIYFSWVEQNTGIAHIKNALNSFPGYYGSSFDTKDQLYICQGGGILLAIDPASGNIVYGSGFPAGITVNDLVFDNTTGKTYGIATSSSLPYPQFDSITLATGALHVIANLPAVSLPSINAYTIDEAAGKYIFVGQTPGASACINYTLFVADISSGAIVNSLIYPYAENTSDPLDSNLLEYSFDNKRGQLYALNWHPTVTTVSPVLTITANADPVCPNTPATFTATSSTGLIDNVYQWQINEANVGTNASVYTNSDPENGDTIRCILAASTTCGQIIIDTSNSIVLKVADAANAAVSITASASNICSGDTVFFTATAVNGGISPSYQWQIDGNSTGTGDSVFSSGSLANGDVISCILQSSEVCSPPAGSADSIIMTVRPTPALMMDNDTTIERGHSIQLTPSITGNIVSYQWTPATGLDNSSVPNPIASPGASTTYRLKIMDQDGCDNSGKITITVFDPLSMPNAFTPNGDGKNDIFRIPPSITIPLFNFSIYNRWGQLIFYTTNPGEGWDGTVNGQPQPTGAYVWVIEYEDLIANKRAVAEGSVMLIR